MPTDATPGVVRYLLGPELVGARLDVALASLTGLPRRRVRAIVEAGRVWLDQRPVRVLSRTLHLADVVDVLAAGETLVEPAPAAPPLTILHEDGHVVAVAKPAGVATQPPRQRREGELTVEELLTLQLARREGRRVRLALIHRLDRLTTGVLLLARGHEAARGLAAAWGSGRVGKRYLAVVDGDPGPGPRLVDAPVIPDPAVPGRFRTASRGRAARTEVRTLAAAGSLALVEVRPLSGRTHQVRVHLHALGHPVTADTLYGGSRRAPRPFLHAWRLDLPHPCGGGRLELVAPVPEDMAAFLAAAGLAFPGAPR